MYLEQKTNVKATESISKFCFYRCKLCINLTLRHLIFFKISPLACITAKKKKINVQISLHCLAFKMDKSAPFLYFL